MHPFLTRLAIRSEVQEFFGPFYHQDNQGSLSFSYGTQEEIYGIGFHRMPSGNNCWIAGTIEPALVRRVIISRSAMDAIAWANCYFNVAETFQDVCFIAIGASLQDERLHWIRREFQCRKHSLLFENDLIGRISDLKAAALLAGIPINIAVADESVEIVFKHRYFCMESSVFSLNAFERVSGFRFHAHTFKPQNYINWLSHVEAQTLKK